jgi:hypothetical protein
MGGIANLHRKNIARLHQKNRKLKKKENVHSEWRDLSWPAFKLCKAKTLRLLDSAQKTCQQIPFRRMYLS